jgi:hypothetical protein
MDKTVIDGILHFFGFITGKIGYAFRNYFDAPIVNGLGDIVGEGAKKLGKSAAPVLQRGRIQSYLVASLAVLLVLIAAYVYFFLV